MRFEARCEFDWIPTGSVGATSRSFREQPGKDLHRLPRLITWLLALLIAVCAFIATDGIAADSKPLKLTILHINDPHSHYLPDKDRNTKELIGGFARAQTVIAEVLAENKGQGRETILLMAGDLLMGTPFSTTFKGRLGAELMNTMKFDATVVGNHEFDYGLRNLFSYVRPMLQFPMLSANIRSECGEYLFKRSLKKGFPGLNTKAVILGLTTADTPITTHPKNMRGLRFDDPVKTARAFLTSVNKRDLVIALTHIGFDQDKKLALLCPRINVIIGGHSHTRLFEPILIGDTVVCQAGAYTRYLGRLDIEFVDGRITQYSGRLIQLDSTVKDDPQIAAIISERQALMDKRLGKVVGRTEVFLEGTRSRVRSDEDTNLATLIAFNMASGSKSDVAVINGGAIRESVRDGEITLADVYTALPFSNTVVTMEMKGSDLLAVLEKSASLEPGHGGKLHTFGIGDRIEDNKVLIDTIRGKPFDPDHYYSAAVNDFLVAGGDGYTIFKERGVNIYDSSVLITDLVINYIKEKKVITKQSIDQMK